MHTKRLALNVEVIHLEVGWNPTGLPLEQVSPLGDFSSNPVLMTAVKFPSLSVIVSVVPNLENETILGFLMFTDCWSSTISLCICLKGILQLLKVELRGVKPEISPHRIIEVYFSVQWNVLLAAVWFACSTILGKKIFWIFFFKPCTRNCKVLVDFMNMSFLPPPFFFVCVFKKS